MKNIIALLLMLLSHAAVAADAGDLHNAVQSACACTVIAVSVGKTDDRATWSVQYDPSATQGQRQAGNLVIASFDMTALSGKTQISRMQALVALNNAGLLTAVQNWVAGQDASTQLIWANAPTFTRNSPLLNRAAAALGLSTSQVDQLFTTAAAITP